MIEPWLAHQRRDAYWKQGSVCEDYSAIEAAVYAVGGWSDGYTNAIPRLLEGLPGPRKGLIGPWAHAWPQAGPPGPDHRVPAGDAALVRPLAGRGRHRDHGRADAAGVDPRLVPPPRLLYGAARAGGSPRRAGPPPGRRRGALHLNADGLGEAAGARGGARHPRHPDRRARRRLLVPVRRARRLARRPARDGRHEPHVHVAAACPSRSRSWASPTSSSRWPLTGRNALVCVRLCEVFADGTSALVTRALQNLTHRESDEHPSRSCRASGSGRRCGSTRPGTRSPPGAASAWASRRHTGRGRGRRPSR